MQVPYVCAFIAVRASRVSSNDFVVWNKNLCTDGLEFLQWREDGKKRTRRYMPTTTTTATTNNNRNNDTINNDDDNRTEVAAPYSGIFGPPTAGYPPRVLPCGKVTAKEKRANYRIYPRPSGKGIRFRKYQYLRGRSLKAAVFPSLDFEFDLGGTACCTPV